MANPGVRWNARDARRAQRFLKSLDPTSRASVADQVLTDLAKLIKADTQENQIVRGRGEDPVAAPPLDDQLSYRSGHLTRSIGTDFSEAPHRYIVGTPVRYGPVHELGLPPYPTRKFLEPAAVESTNRHAKRLFRLALERSAAKS